MTDGPDNSDLDPRDLEAWQVPEPPADFAARVIAARGRSISVQPVTAAAPRRWALAAVVVAAAVVAVLVAGGRGGAVATSGSRQAAVRETVALGARGVAVAEAGAALRWNIDSRGAADVDQTAGDVFYRVERGGKFAVATPAGVVTVVGTCFRVAIRNPDDKESEMKPNKQLAIGAALGALVVVTVYEGRVLFADKRGDTETVEAGESVTAGGGPTRLARNGEAGAVTAAKPADMPAPPSADVTRDQLLARDEVQRTEIAQLREKVRGFESGAIVVRKEGGGEDGRPSFDPSHDELLQWAKDCKVQFDTPPIRGSEPTDLPPRAAEKLGLSVEEVAALNKTTRTMFETYSKQVRALYVEATGDTAGAESLSVDSMAAEIQEKSPPEERGNLMKRLAEERAGLRPPPADLTKLIPMERYYRLLGALGDDTERMLAAEVGPERAREIREANDGWGSRMQVAGCPESDEPPDVDDMMKAVKPEN